MAKHGPKSITICARSVESLKDACETVNNISLKIAVDYYPLDLADQEGIIKTVEAITEHHSI